MYLVYMFTLSSNYICICLLTNSIHRYRKYDDNSINIWLSDVDNTLPPRRRRQPHYKFIIYEMIYYLFIYLFGAGVAQWSRSWLRLTQLSVQFIAKCKKMCVILRSHQFPVLSSDCVIRFPTRSHSTGSEDRTCLLLEKGGSIIHIVIYT